MKLLYTLILILFIGCGEKTDISESIQYNNRDAFIKIGLDLMYPVPRCSYLWVYGAVSDCPIYSPDKHLDIYSEENFYDENQVLVKTKFKLRDNEHTHIYGYDGNGLITDIYDITPFRVIGERLNKFEYDSDNLLIKHNRYSEKGYGFEMEDDSSALSGYRFITNNLTARTDYRYENGRLVRIEDWTGANFTNYIDFQYNSKGQIETMVKYSEGAIITGLDGSDKKITYYKYDSSGNVISPSSK